MMAFAGVWFALSPAVRRGAPWPLAFFTLLVFCVPLRAQEDGVAPDEAAATPATPKSGPTPVDRHAAIYAALASPTTVKVFEKPLSEVAKNFAEQHKIPIQFDERALDDLGLSTKQPITRHLVDLPLETVLDLLLGELDLAWVVRHEVLFITSVDEAAELLNVRVYPVGDLIETNEKGLPDYESLIRVATSSVAPTSWDELGGSGSVQFFADKLVVAQTELIHREIAQLLAMLRRATTEPGVVNEPVITTVNRHTAKIERALNQETTFEFVGTSLRKVMASLAKSHGIQIELDERALDDLGISTDQPVTFHVSKVLLRSALALMLDELDLTAIVRHRVLMITSVDEAAEMLEVKVYPVEGMRRPPSPVAMGGSSGIGHLALDAKAAQEAEGKEPNFDRLIDTITLTIGPTTWEMVGGSGVIVPFRETLVVAQTAPIHDKILQLLGGLREKVE